MEEYLIHKLYTDEKQINPKLCPIPKALQMYRTSEYKQVRTLKLVLHRTLTVALAVLCMLP